MALEKLVTLREFFQIFPKNAEKLKATSEGRLPNRGKSTFFYDINLLRENNYSYFRSWLFSPFSGHHEIKIYIKGTVKKLLSFNKIKIMIENTEKIILGVIYKNANNTAFPLNQN